MMLVGGNTQQAAVAGRRILALILADYRGPVAIRLWDGELAIGHDNAPCTVVFHQLWRLYMAGSAYYFDEGGINVYQVLAGHDREPLAIALRRDELYAKGCECQPYQKSAKEV